MPVPTTLTPPRLSACSQENDIPIIFVRERSDSGDIPGLVFAETAHNGHPIGVSTKLYYMHDISGCDHFPAVIAGGRPLINWLSENAPEGRDFASIYDTATSIITTTIQTLCYDETEVPRIYIGAELRQVVDLLKSNNEWSSVQTIKDQLRERELRKILYSGLKNCGVHRPELVTQNRWNSIARSVIWATVGK